MSTLLTLFVALLFSSLTEGFLGLGAIGKIAQQRFPQAMSAKRALAHVEDTFTPSNGECIITSYSRDFWKRNGGISFDLLGNWTGGGVLRFVNKTNAQPLFEVSVTDVWNITFDRTIGAIQWMDTFRPVGFPDSPPDNFTRYLVPNANGLQGGFTQCTTLAHSATPDFIDLEIDSFGLPTSLSILVNRFTGVQGSVCSYYVGANPVIVDCIYFDTQASIPIGTLLNYQLTMYKS
jgi:hypothetical protein